MKKTLPIFVLFILITSIIVANSLASLPAERQTLALPSLATFKATQKTATSPVENDWTLHEIKIKKNGSLSTALYQANLNNSVAFKVQKLENSHLLTTLQVGDVLSIWTEQNKLKRILYKENRTTHHELTEKNGEFSIQTIEIPVETRIVTAHGEIKHSFYLSGQQAGLSAKTIMNLADIFAWQIDFIRQLRPGDPFKLIYERKYINGNYIGDGRILAAQITTNNGETHDAFLLTDSNGNDVGYFNSEKRNLRKAFLRNPVDYVRITSHFNPKRFHPILKKWKAHRGVDYGGPTGTPIRTTGDGKIIRRGWGNAYGNVIYIQHAGKYVTVYAHMSKFGKYKKGDWVRQGQVIGYIGSTGRSTGPHLHYEFRKNGRHIDPLKVKFPDAGPVPKKYRQQFAHFSGLMSTQLDRLSSDIQLARNFE